MKQNGTKLNNNNNRTDGSLLKLENEMNNGFDIK